MSGGEFSVRWDDIKTEALAKIDAARARPNEGLHAALIEMVQRGALIEQLANLLDELRKSWLDLLPADTSAGSHRTESHIPAGGAS